MNLNIGKKLTIGFGILVILMLSVGGLGYLFSIPAAENIDRTGELRFPTAIFSSRAQTDLLRMLGSMQAFLASGDEKFKQRFDLSRQAFLRDLEALAQLSANFDAENKERLETLKATIGKWSPLPDRLFELRMDPMRREPAYRLLMVDGTKLANTVLVNTKQLIDSQSQNVASEPNMRLLNQMARFHQSFTAMYSGLRAYAITRNHDFKREYNISKISNHIAWLGIESAKPFLPPDRQDKIDVLSHNLKAFTDNIPDRVFQLTESERWREDIFLFRSEAMPLAMRMESLLGGMTDDQQNLLRTELETGKNGLDRANWLTLLGSVVALVIGVVLSFFFRENIAGPIRRLTVVAERIHAGDLSALAPVESMDETGMLAETFNKMTTQLRDILTQIAKEKKRADDLLDVVIPIGVQLTSERDYNRLLEKMLGEARAFCHADAGTLYLRDENDRLVFSIVQNESEDSFLGGTSGQPIPFAPLSMTEECDVSRCHIAVRAALTGNSFNIPDYSRESDILTDYRIKSMLTIPLKNSADRIIGVLQLLNAQDPETGQIIPFDANLQRMMESFSLLEVAALEAYIREQGLRSEIRRLRIEIDEAKREKQTREIVESDSFKKLRAKAAEMRQRRIETGVSNDR